MAVLEVICPINNCYCIDSFTFLVVDLLHETVGEFVCLEKVFNIALLTSAVSSVV
jgi:hypothetical protein